MEEYKKKYEQALENLKKIKAANKDNKELVDFIEYEYPELKESEDERIRRDIIRYLKKTSPAIGENIEKMLAWLEKQGEKIDAIENLDTEFEKQVSHLIASAINKEHEYNQSYVKWTANALLNYAKHELEKQGEQNNKHLYDVIIALWDLLDKIDTFSDLQIDDTNPDNPFRKIEHITQERYKFVKSDEYNLYIKGEQITDFKQDEQKPAWSEEDERYYDSALWHIKNSSGREGSVYNWLKSLKERYTWKPSNEQMDALNIFIGEANSYDTAAGYEEAEILSSLYEQLKKLKGE